MLRIQCISADLMLGLWMPQEGHLNFSVPAARPDGPRDPAFRLPCFVVAAATRGDLLRGVLLRLRFPGHVRRLCGWKCGLTLRRVKVVAAIFWKSRFGFANDVYLVSRTTHLHLLLIMTTPPVCQ